VDDLTLNRVIILVLGAVGLPMALSLLDISMRTMKVARRRSIRYTSSLFFVLACGLTFMMAGEAGVTAWLLIACAGQSLLPALVHIGSMVIMDVALLGMLLVNRFIDKEVRTFESPR